MIRLAPPAFDDQRSDYQFKAERSRHASRIPFKNSGVAGVDGSHLNSNPAAHCFLSRSESIGRVLPVILRNLLVVVAFWLGVGLAEQAFALPEQIQPTLKAQSRTLVVGSEQDYPPFATGMTDATAGGFTVDLWRVIADAASLKYTVRVLPFHQLLAEFKRGEIDVLINLAVSDERRQFAHFSVPHVTVHGAIFVRDDEFRIRSEADLEGKSVLVLNADLAHDYAVAKGWGPHLVPADTAAQGLQRLAAGKSDAMLLSELTGLQTLRALALSNIKVLPVKAGFAQKFAFATQHGQTELLDTINEELAVAKANGRYDALYEKWFDQYTVKQVGLVDILRYVIPVSMLLLASIGYMAYRSQVERKKAEEVVAAAAQYARSLIEASLDPLVTISPQGKITDANRATEKVTGLDKEHLIGSDFADYFTDPDEARKGYQRVFADGYVTDYPLAIRHSSGRVTDVLYNASVYCDASGAVSGVFAAARDVTERLIAEDKLRTLSIAVEQSSASVVITDKNAIIEYVNPQFTKASGYSAMEAIGANPRILQSKQTHDETYRRMWDTLSSGEPWNGEFINKRKSGEIYWEEGHISPVKNSLGCVTHYVAIKTDITERIRSTEKINTLMQEQRTILNNSLVGIVTVRDRKILWANRAFESMLGYGPGEMLGLSTRMTYASDEVYQAFGAKAYPVLLAGEVYRSWSEFIGKNGERVWMDVSGETLHATRGDSLWCFIDITERKAIESRLVQSETKTKSVLESAADAIFILDQRGQLQYVNDSALVMLGYERTTLQGMTIENIVPLDDAPAMLNRFKQLVVSGALRCELRLACSDGASIPVDFNGAVLPDGSVFGSCRDISARKKTEALLVEREAHLQAIIENEPECIKIIDSNGLLIQMNAAGLAMIEADSFSQVKDRPVLHVVAPEYREAFWDLHQRVIAGEHIQMEFEVQGLKGGRRWMETHAVPMKEYGRTVHLAVTRDITQRKLMERQVSQLAFHDSLTGLANRRLLLDRLGQAMAAGKRSGCFGALIFLDLDNFKVLNDTHGHSTGDMLLIEVAKRLKGCVREVDTVSRFGGDEFVVLLSKLDTQRDVSTAQAAMVAEKIRAALQQPYFLSVSNANGTHASVDHHCTSSIGVAIFTNDQGSDDDILKWADNAMYKAKKAGRNAIRFHGVPGHD